MCCVVCALACALSEWALLLLWPLWLLLLMLMLLLLRCYCYDCCCCCCFAFHLSLCMCFKMNAHIFLCAPVQLFICCVILLFIYLFLLFLCMGMSVCAFFCAILLLSTHTPFRLLSLSFSHLTHTLLLALDFSASRFDLSLGWFMWFFLLLLALFLIAYSVLLSFSECLLCCCCCRLCVSTRESTIFLWLHHHLCFSFMVVIFLCTQTEIQIHAPHSAPPSNNRFSPTAATQDFFPAINFIMLHAFLLLWMRENNCTALVWCGVV